MNKKLFLGSLPLTTTEAELKELFARCGQITSLMLIKDRATNANRGFGFVEKATEEGARMAVEKLNGHMLAENKMVVKEALAKTSYRGMNDTRSFGNRGYRRF